MIYDKFTKARSIDDLLKRADDKLNNENEIDHPKKVMKAVHRSMNEMNTNVRDGYVHVTKALRDNAEELGLKDLDRKKTVRVEFARSIKPGNNVIFYDSNGEKQDNEDLYRLTNGHVAEIQAEALGIIQEKEKDVPYARNAEMKINGKTYTIERDCEYRMGVDGVEIPKEKMEDTINRIDRIGKYAPSRREQVIENTTDMMKEQVAIQLPRSAVIGVTSAPGKIHHAVSSDVQQGEQILTSLLHGAFGFMKGASGIGR